MDERNSIINDLVVSGLSKVLPIQASKVLSAMAFLADPYTREVTKRVDEIAGKTDTMMFPEQVAGVIRQLCESGIVERVSEGDPPTYRVAADYGRLVEIEKEIGEMNARGEERFPYVAPSRTNFRER